MVYEERHMKMAVNDARKYICETWLHVGDDSRDYLEKMSDDEFFAEVVKFANAKARSSLKP